MPDFEWPGYKSLGNGGWRGEGGGWSFNCVDCWFHMENMGQLACESHAFTHQAKKHHSVILTNPEGNKKMYRCAILNESDQPF